MIKKEMERIGEEVVEIRRKLDEIARVLDDEDRYRADRERLYCIQKNTEISQEFISNEYVALYCREKSHMPRVLVCGFYGARNVGDELMLEAILDLIPTDRLDVTILLSNNYDLDAGDYAPYKVLHYPKRSSDIVAIAENFDAVIWGGGAMLDDVEYVYRGQYSTMAYYLMSITKAVLKNGGKAFVYGVSANNEIDDKTFIKDLNYIIKYADYFSLRDTNSLQVLKEAGVETEKIQVIDDLSIYNLRDKTLRVMVDKSNDELCVGLNLILDEQRAPECEKIILNIKEYFGDKVKFVLIPFYDYENHDMILLRKIVDRIKEKSIVCEIADQPRNMDDLLDIFGRCDYVFAMRYHAALMASLTHKHTVMIDFKNNHRHYLNKNSYLKSKYVPNLLVLEYNDLYENGMSKDIKIPETGVGLEQRAKIAGDIEKNVQDSLSKIGGNE